MKVNKKLVMAALVAVVVAAVSFAKIMGARFKPTESEKEFDVLYLVTPDMKAAKVKANKDVHVTQAFKINKNGKKGELRYSLFTDCGDPNDEEDFKVNYALQAITCAFNVVGFEFPAEALTKFNDDDVKNEFNGDLGCTIFIQDPKSEYAKGYKYMTVEFFCKKGQGLVMRSYLFNDIAFVGLNDDGSISPDSPLFTNYYTFKFMEKDADGNYIHE